MDERILFDEDYDALRRIETVLYDDRPLAGDRRRDLANALNAILHGIDAQLHPTKRGTSGLPR